MRVSQHDAPHARLDTPAEASISARRRLRLPSTRVTASCLAALGLLTRLPFQSRILYHWDSVNFALATQRFDISPQFEQPQPPGYILYVGLAKLLETSTGNPQTSYVWISMLASALAVALCLYVGTLMFGRTAGIVASLLLLTDPLFWFYGEVALPHALDMALVLASVLLLYQAVTRARQAMLLGAVVLALAGGVRPQTLFFLLPLYFYVAILVGNRYALWSALILIVCTLIWLFPLVWITGGLERYWQILADYSLRFERSTSVFLGAGSAGLLNNVNKLVRYTLYGLGLTALPLAGGLMLSFKAWRKTVRDRRTHIIALWSVPCILFYIFILMGQQGLIFVYLPALLLISAAVLVKLARVSRIGQWSAAGFLGLALLFNTWLFVFAPEHLAGRADLKVLNRSTIQDSDVHFTSLIRKVTDEFAPANTIILTANWRHVEYYLPAYLVLHAPPPDDDSTHRFNPASRQANTTQVKVILFDVQSTEWNSSSPSQLEGGQLDPFVLLTLDSGDVLVYSNEGVHVEKHQPE